MEESGENKEHGKEVRRNNYRWRQTEGKNEDGWKVKTQRVSDRGRWSRRQRGGWGLISIHCDSRQI